MSGETLELRLARRAIRRWDHTRAAEPAHGFMLRIAARHHQSSATAFLRDIAIDNIVDVQACLAAALASELAIDEGDREALRRWTAVVDGDTVRLAGEVVRRGDWSAKTRHYCAACLAEDQYHRAWFDLTFVATCPIHGTPVTDRLENGLILSWNHASLTHTSWGLKIAREAPRLPETPRTIEAYALGRLGIIPALDVPLCDGAPLGQVVEAVEMLGRLKLGGWRLDLPLLNSPGFEETKVRDVGFAVVDAGSEGIKALFREVAAGAPPTTFGAKTLFGWAVRMFSQKEELAHRFYHIGGVVAVELGRGARRKSWKQLDVKPQLVTLGEIGARLDVSPNVLLHVTEMLGVLLPHTPGPGVPYLVAEADFEAIADVIRGSLSRTDAARYLCVSHDLFTMIVRQNHIPKVGTRWGYEGPGGGLEDRYRAPDLAAFLDRIPVATANPLTPTGEMIRSPHVPTIPEILDATAYDPGTFFEDVFSGAIVVSERTGLLNGLRDFRVEPWRQPLSHPFTKRCNSSVASRGDRKATGMSQKEVCANLNVEPNTAKLLVDLGYLRVEPGMSAANRQKLDADVVMAFCERYAPGKIYAEALGCHPSHASAKLADMGVEHLFAGDHPGKDFGKISPLYERAELRRVLRLDRDPDDDPGIRCWKRLAASLGRNRSCFAIWRVWGSEAALLSTSNAEWPVRIWYDFDTEVEHPYPLADPFAYTIRAELRIKGEKGRQRIDALVETYERRRIDGAMRVRHDRSEGTFTAELDARVVNSSRNGLSGMAWVEEYGALDTDLIERMLLKLKASFEPLVGTRRYDHRLTGLWGDHFWRWTGERKRVAMGGVPQLAGDVREPIGSVE